MQVDVYTVVLYDDHKMVAEELKRVRLQLTAAQGSLKDCYMLARRELWRASRGKELNPVSLESIVRVCEAAGLKPEILREEQPPGVPHDA